MSKKVLATFPVQIDFHLNESQIKEGLKQLNIFYTGDTECNIRKGNELVSKYPEIEKSNPKFTESHYAIHRGHQAKIQVELLEDGNLRIKK